MYPGFFYIFFFKLKWYNNYFRHTEFCYQTMYLSYTFSYSPCTALAAGICGPLGLWKRTISGLWKRNSQAVTWYLRSTNHKEVMPAVRGHASYRTFYHTAANPGQCSSLNRCRNKEQFWISYKKTPRDDGWVSYEPKYLLVSRVCVYKAYHSVWIICLRRSYPLS